mmetsp:Transcript_28339/g.91801  ORF Transcript_28339/g.91801 Transcript_28339/m.91801 type:complete len:300 (-) Transcript_28339:52-951(-)
MQVVVAHHALHVHHRLRDAHRRQVLARLLHCAQQLEHRLLVAPRVHARARLELLRHLASQLPVVVAPAQAAVPSGGHHRQAALQEGHHRHLQRRVAHVHEHDVLRLRVREETLGRLVDPILERRRSRVVHQAEAVDARNAARVKHGTTLRIRKVDRGGEHDVGDGRPTTALLHSDLHAVDHHRHQARHCEHGGRAVEHHLDADLVVLHGHQLEGEALQLPLNERRAELESNEALQVHHRVLEVGTRHRHCRLANEALLILEGHHRGCLAMGRLVEDHVHASAPHRRSDTAAISEIDSDD